MDILLDMSDNLKSSFISGLQLLNCLTNVLRSAIMERFLVQVGVDKPDLGNFEILSPLSIFPGPVSLLMQILMVSTLRGLLNGDDVVGGVGGGLNLPGSELIHLSSRASCHLGSQITAAVGSERRVMR